MDHPSIAKVFDGGMTEQGRPYFVMEYVKGVPLTEYCDQARLSLKERLNLFMSVCQAVQHAHQKGIIHRDLKPSNILICLYDGKPVPKVIDFGLAKAMHQSLTDQSLHTAHGVMVGTPLYMSPEQAEYNNLDVDTRTDIYSLGVILYELLTGSTPLERQQMKNAAFNEILRLIKEVEPPKPSTRLSGSANLPSVAAQRSIDPKQLSRLVTGDLDWIVMKSLDKERGRRYETANGLARDVERFLNDEAVEACPPSSSYLLKKFVRRNKRQVVAASFVMLALITGVVGTTLGLLEARKQTALTKIQEAIAKKQEKLARDEATAKELALAEESRQRKLAQANEARAESEKKRAIEFRDKALDALRATTGTDVEQLIGSKTELGANERAYLEAIAKRWQAFANQEGTDEQSRAIRAEGHAQVALLWQKLGRPDEARLAYKQAVEIQGPLVADFPAVPAYSWELGRSHNRLGLLLLQLNKVDEAKAEYRTALEIRRKLVDQYPENPEYQYGLGGTYCNLASLWGSLRNHKEASAGFRSALEILQPLVKRFSDVPAYQKDLATTQHNYAHTLRDLGQRDEANREYRAALELQSKLVEQYPNDPAYNHDLARTYFSLGVSYKDLGKPVEEEDQYRKSLDIESKLAVEYPLVPHYRQERARCHSTLGVMFSERGKPAEAQEQYRTALDIRAKLADDFPRVPNYRQELARNHSNLGLVLSELQKRMEAEQQFRQAVAILETLVAEFRTTKAYKIDLGGELCQVRQSVPRRRAD